MSKTGYIQNRIHHNSTPPQAQDLEFCPYLLAVLPSSGHAPSRAGQSAPDERPSPSSPMHTGDAPLRRCISRHCHHDRHHHRTVATANPTTAGWDGRNQLIPKRSNTLSHQPTIHQTRAKRQAGRQDRPGKTHPHPSGVVTPKKQSPSALGTTWSALMGMVTTPALASEAQHSENTAAARATGFMVAFDSDTVTVTVAGGVDE